MGKIIQITENQYKQLNTVLSEQSVSDFKDFQTNVNVEIDYLHREINGRSIWGITPLEKSIPITFDIDIYLRKWGIDDVIITNLRGPKTIMLELELEPLTDDDSDYYYEHQIILDWSNVEIEYDGNSNPKGIESIVIELDDFLFTSKIIVTPRFS
jgi:hypothetical protein